MMTAQHSSRIAAALQLTRPNVNGNPSMARAGRDSALVQWQVTVEEMAYVLSRENPRFDQDRFLDACGYFDQPTRLSNAAGRPYGAFDGA